MARRAVSLNANCAWAFWMSGAVHVFAAQPDTAMQHLERARRLSPKDFELREFWIASSDALVQLERDDEAISAAQTAVQYAPDYLMPWLSLSAARALAGRLDQAQIAVARAMEIRPSFRLSRYRSWYLRINPAANLRQLEGLRLAGMPE
jgi:tetratricopeptide (TPR) repeat protein